MAEDQDQSQKTEDPSHKRLEEAHKRGQVIASREINHFLLLFSLALIIMWMLPTLLVDAKVMFLPFINNAHDFEIDFGNFNLVMERLLADLFVLMLLPFVAALIAVFASAIIQNKWVFSFTPIEPKLEKISPMKGIERLFSRRTLVEFIKNIIKITIVGIIAYIAVAPYNEMFRLMPDEDLNDTLTFMGKLAERMLIGVCVIMFFIAILDYLYQRFEFLQSLRMTKQEVKDEYKQQEGDPIIKQRLRALRRERARKRMMAEVPKSDVIITNPTHYAVALEYKAETMTAPRVLAKGVDKVALRIRELAIDHKIPIVRNPPLARVLYDTVDLEDEIPYEHYKAVAEVIGYVYKLKGIKPKGESKSKGKASNTPEMILRKPPKS